MALAKRFNKFAVLAVKIHISSKIIRVWSRNLNDSIFKAFCGGAPSAYIPYDRFSKSSEGAPEVIVPVILSGGSGTRLWPLSTPARPKQFLPLLTENSMFADTLARVADRDLFAPPVVVSNADHEALCRAEISDVEGAVLILEPCARNTAAAIAMAAQVIGSIHGPDAAMLVMPSDHAIIDIMSFHDAVQIGLRAASSGCLVTFGICPTGPETGYGYIHYGPLDPPIEGVLKVQSFTEKPNREVAEAMLADGSYLWNGGIFLFQAGTLIDEIALHAPEIAASAADAIASAERNGMAILADDSALKDCPSISIDYAVMERSSNVVAVPLKAGWSDVGCWDALAEIAGTGDSEDQLVTRVESADCYVRSDGLKVSLVGVENLLVVAAGDRVLIMRKGRSQDVKQVLSRVHGHTD